MEKSGCIETFLSGPSLERSYSQRTGATLSVKEIVAVSEAGDLDANYILDKFENNLAKGLAQVINILDPELIIMGGGLSNIARLYYNVPKYLDKFVFSDYITTKIVPAQYGDASGVRGAAWLWNDEKCN